MPRKSRDNQPPLLTERNLDRLGFFSVQSRLTLETSWESQFQIGGRSVHVHGEGTRGRPHGADTDLMLGVEQLFIAAGSPEDNWLHTTPNALRTAALMSKNGRAFHRMREGLLRIWSAGYIVREGWTAPDGSPVRFNAAFRLFEELRYWDRETTELPELLPEARLSIKLSDPLAASIRAGYTHALSRQVLTHLEQPHSRALYRLAEAHRYDERGTRRKELSVPLLEWREACGIRDDRASKVIRALSSAHEELEAAGYLSEVKISGRGQRQVLTYVFRHESEPDPALVKLLIAERLSAPVPFSWLRTILNASNRPSLISTSRAVKAGPSATQQGSSPISSPTPVSMCCQTLGLLMRLRSKAECRHVCRPSNCGSSR
ncbi:replication initiator protein A [Deinococcus lacus]|uniref:Replication initiator protein A n=1 Tax=Deinococcus lacus TaxID=392561 RepID=A0ABW1YGR3_9DEIO